MIGPYLVHTVTLKQFMGKDQWGEPLDAVSVVVKARVDYKETVVTDVGTELITSRMRVTMRNRDVITSGFSTRDLNTISYEDVVNYAGVDRNIQHIAIVSDFSQRFIEVYLR